MSVSDPRDMTPEQLAIALTNCGTLEQWIKSVKDYAFELMQNGGKIPGFKLGYGAKRRIWRGDSEPNIVKKLKAHGLDSNILYTQPELLSPAKMEALLKEHSLWPAKPRGGDRPPTPIDEFIDYSMPEPRVMPVGEREDVRAKHAEAARDFK